MIYSRLHQTIGIVDDTGRSGVSLFPGLARRILDAGDFPG